MTAENGVTELKDSTGIQKVYTNLLPFNLNKKAIEVPAGLTIREMINRVIPKQAGGIDIVVTINGEPVPVFAWDSLRPKSHTLVGVHVTPGKGKNPLGTILSIALMVAAPYAAGAAVGALANAGVTSLTAAQAVFGAVRIGMGVVGFLINSMLSSVPKQNNAKSVKESPTQFIEGASNEVDPYGVIQVNLGTNRMFPKQAARPYTETAGNKQYSRQLFTWGYGKVLVDKLQIGETALNTFTQVSVEHRLDADLNEGTGLYTNDVFQDGYSAVLSNVADFILRTTQDDTDEASIDITFPSGLTKFSSSGAKSRFTVNFDIQYSPTGAGTWSTGAAGAYFAANSITAPNPPSVVDGVMNNILFMNISSGELRILTYKTDVPPAPDGSVRLASFTTRCTAVSPYAAVIENFNDDRSPSIPSIIDDSASFVPSFTDMSIDVTDGDFSGLSLTVSGAQSEALRISKNIVFPTRGQYDIRIKRTTADSSDDKIFDEATWTAMRSITYSEPVRQADISGTAMRILATNQLNGLVDRLNGIVSTLILDYDEDADEWIERPSSNPASIYRYVLQCQAFAKRVTDDRIDLEKLQEWHIYCEEEGLSYNRIVDYETDIEDVLNDVAAAGMATKWSVDGIYSVIIDNERPEIKGMVNPRNSWGYGGNINYPEIPHALRVEFRNKDAGYNLDEVIVYADGYDEETATLYERLSFPSCTNSDLAWYYGRMYLATAILQPEIHKFKMDFESMTFNRGDRIQFVNDTILVGVGYGRIKELIFDDPDTPTEITGFILDDIVSIPTANNFGVRIRYSDASSFTYHALDTVVGETNTLTFSTPVEIDMGDPDITYNKFLGALCNFTEFGKELDLVVLEIDLNAEQKATITAVNYAPERFDSVTGPIPHFTSNITIPVELLAPYAPVLAGTQSDESVMTRSGDGSFTGRMVISLTNTNESSVIPTVRYRYSNTTEWFTPNILIATANVVVLTGLDDGVYYDFEIRYQRQVGLNLLSPPLQLNNLQYVGASSIPSDVENFRCVISGGQILLSWDKNPEIDIDYYTIVYSSLYSGATYGTAQIVAERVYENRITLPYQGGTYLIKAVDLLGNESDGATAIITFNADSLKNVVEELIEEPDFGGTHDNTQVYEGNLVLVDTSLSVGYYYFEDSVDLTEVYDCVLSAAVQSSGIFLNDLFDVDDIFDMDDVFGSGDNNIFDMDDIFAVDDVFGIGSDSWGIQLQYRISQDGVTFSDWEEFTSGNVVGQVFEFRIKLESFAQNISPSVSLLHVILDMPDRIERQEDLDCDASTGAVVVYSTPFKNNPAVAITTQNGQSDDRYDFISKDSSGFVVKVWNVTAGAYVDRIIDYIASGYGRVQI